MIRSQQWLTLISADESSRKLNVSLVNQATPKLSEDKVKQCVDVRLNGDYPPKGVVEVLKMVTLAENNTSNSRFLGGRAKELGCDDLAGVVFFWPFNAAAVSSPGAKLLLARECSSLLAFCA
ncbi:hypothetical protein Patl1_27135 [Pistacia atlantica]|uniref:Uncharacterized protein n=1 Tax=Pistacia atlantica TaxID=434234 RepID=A0ACC1B2V9_9ROSI|nr:hypothetical protein Patl1_27135 [Pistacia atlantica]